LEKLRLKDYAHNLPELWNAPTTRPQDKKRIIRCLIDSVVIQTPKDAPMIQVQIHWKSGQTTPLEVRRRRRTDAYCVTDSEIVELVRELAKNFSDTQIARIMHRKKFKSAKGKSFTRYLIANLRHRYNIDKGPPPPSPVKTMFTHPNKQGSCWE